MVSARFSALRGIRPHEYLIRFLFGGAATVLAGLIAQHWGPLAGGLFLAFPAIFPASVTLIEKHERQRKSRIGYQGIRRGRDAAALESAGAALGCLGLFAFALVVRRLLPAHSGWLSLALACLAWAAVSCGCWFLRRKRLFHRPGSTRRSASSLRA